MTIITLAPLNLNINFSVQKRERRRNREDAGREANVSNFHRQRTLFL